MNHARLLPRTGHLLRVAAIAVPLLLLDPLQAKAQAPTKTPAPRVAWTLTVARAFATGGPASVVTTPSLRTLELEAARRGATGRWWRVEHTFGLVMQAWLQGTALGPAEIVPIPPRGEWRVPTQAGRTTGRALGLRPLGVRFVVGPADVQLETELAAGALLFNVPAPASNTSRLNFTGQGGVGIRVNVPGGAIGGGYRFHHLSNAGRGEVNPGVDSHMLYFSMSLH